MWPAQKTVHSLGSGQSGKTIQTLLYEKVEATPNLSAHNYTHRDQFRSFSDPVMTFVIQLLWQVQLLPFVLFYPYQKISLSLCSGGHTYINYSETSANCYLERAKKPYFLHYGSLGAGVWIFVLFLFSLVKYHFNGFGKILPFFFLWVYNQSLLV